MYWSIVKCRLFTAIIDISYRSFSDITLFFTIADPNQAANNNHVNSVSEGLPESGTKTFYENLPFHGIQTPPNKVSITIIKRGITGFCQTAWTRLDLQLAY